MDKVPKICDQLQSSERLEKITALRELQFLCESPSTTSTQVLTIFDDCYLFILKCYADRYESIRNEAALAVNKFIEKLPPNDFHLLNVFSTLTERMGKQETVEKSEEMRLLYVTQINILIQKYIRTGNARFLEECYPELSDILVKSLCDCYPAVQKEACRCIVLLADNSQTYKFQKYAERLTKPLYTMLNHKHSQARISSVQALSCIGLHLNNSDDLTRLLMEVSPLLMDSIPLVRKECGLLGVRMLMQFKDRYSYFDRIIPLVLCCLKDDSPDVQKCILPLWVKCGKQYYDENESELNKRDIADLLKDNYPLTVQRPTIGCRALVQRSLRLLKLITRETSDWKENVRLHSLKLLFQFVLHAETAMTSMFFEIYPDVARACGDNEKVIENEAIKVADLMGRFFVYDDWIDYGFDGLTNNAKEGYLICFYYMFTATSVAKFSDLLRVSYILIEPTFSQNLKPRFQIYVLMLVETLVNKFENERIKMNINEYAELNKNIYITTIKVMALSIHTAQIHTDELQTKGNNILAKIALSESIDVSTLHQKYFLHALYYVGNLENTLDSQSEPILLLHGLISICKLRSTYIKALESHLNKVWRNCADDAKVKIFSVISIVLLQWNETMGLEIPESCKILTEFVKSVIEQHLIWKAGVNAETMRSLATASLCALSQGAQIEARNVLPTLSKYFPSLIEDQSISTRNYAIKCLNNFGEIKLEDLKAIGYAILQRLDDPSSTIREQAASVIPKLKPIYGKTENDINQGLETWHCFICKAIELLLLHLNGPELRLKSVITKSLVNLATDYPDDFKTIYKQSVAQYINVSCLMDLIKDLPFEI